MRVSTVGTLLAGAVLAGCAVSGAQSAFSAPGRIHCSQLDYAPMIQQTENLKPPKGFLRVPVAIHIMDRYWDTPGKRKVDKRREKETPKTVEAERTEKVPVLRFWAPRNLRPDDLEPRETAPGDVRDGVRTYFGSTGELTINHVWAQAGIRFDVVSVERCFYSAPPPRVNGTWVLTPDRTDFH